MKNRHLSTSRRIRNTVLACSWLMIAGSWWSGQPLWLWGGAVLVNLYAAVIMAKDKRYAREGRLRIPESSLLLTAALGGAAGAWAAMMLFRHKTKHLSFTLTIPLFLIIQAYLLILAVRHY
ncbi:DUF1294 domain-containing protein [Brevibacillus composti]|nr:DUF1294 domain-containing protein [Brevibacillus composti]